MHRLSIVYEAPEDPERFDDHYERVHVPLAEKIPGLRRMVRSRPQAVRGGAPHLVVELWFDDRDALDEALMSPEMAAAADDARGMDVSSSMFSGDVIEASFDEGH